VKSDPHPEWRKPVDRMAEALALAIDFIGEKIASDPERFLGKIELPHECLAALCNWYHVRDGAAHRDRPEGVPDDVRRLIERGSR
jgi:hypothetical protein